MRFAISPPLAILVIFFSLAQAQIEPTTGLRDNTPAVHAFVNARIVTAPGRIIEKGTLVIRDGVIETVGERVAIPADAKNVFNAFKEMADQGSTVIIVTHDRELVQNVPKIFELSDGMIGRTTLEAAARRRTQELQALRLAHATKEG